MLKKVLLTTAAAAILAVSAQGAATPVLAAQINIKPKVKIAPKPRIRVVKPRVRVRVNTKSLAKKKANENGNRNADSQNSQSTVTGTPRTKVVPQRFVALPLRNPQRVTVDDPLQDEGDKVSELAQIQGLEEAMNAAKEMIQVATIGATFPLPDPLNPEEDKQPEVPGGDTTLGFGSGLVTPGSRQLGDPHNGAGPNAEVFGFLTNSHGKGPRNTPGTKTGDASKDALGVTPGRIAAGIGGVAGDGATSRTTTYRNPENGTIVIKSVHLDPDTDGPAGADVTKITVTPSDSSPEMSRLEDTVGYGPTGNPVDRTVVTQSQAGGPENVHYTSYLTGLEETWVRGRRGQRIPGTRRVIAPASIDRLYDPDYVGGGGNHPFHWLKKQPETIGEKVAKIGPGGLTRAPDQATPLGWSLGTPVISQDRLVSTYDPDSTDRGSPTPLPTCFGSEC